MSQAEPLRSRSRLANPHDVALPPSRLPRAVQIGGLVGFGLLLVVSVYFSLTDHWRRASFIFGAALLWLAVLRATCDSRILGVLTVRSRRFDVIFESALGLIMVFLAVSIDALRG